MKKYRLLFFTFLFLLIPSFVFASSYARIEHPKFQAYDSSGDPCSGCLLYTYEPGTSTPKTTYDADDSANANPVVLNSNGRAEVYGTGYYKLILKTSSGTTIWTLDNIAGINESSFTTIGSYNGDFDAAVTAIGATATTLFIDDTATMSEAVTVPSTLKVVVEKGGTINQSTYALTFNGDFEAGLYQVFTGTGAVTINSDTNLYPEWWGAKSDGGTTDCTNAFNYMLANDGTMVLTGNGSYYQVTGRLTIQQSNTHFLGVGSVRPKIVESSNTTDYLLYAESDLDHLSFRNIELQGSGASDWDDQYALIQLGYEGDGSDEGVTDVVIDNCVFSNKPNAVYVWFDGNDATDIYFTNNKVSGATTGLKVTTDTSSWGGYFADRIHATGNNIVLSHGTTAYSRGVTVAIPKNVWVKDNYIIGGGMAAEFYAALAVYTAMAESELNFQNIVFANNMTDTEVSYATTVIGNHFDGNLIPSGRGFQNTIIIEANPYQDTVVKGNILENYDAVTGAMVGVKASYRNTIVSGNIFRKFKTTSSVALSYTIQATAFDAYYERLSRFIFNDNLLDGLQYGIYDSTQSSVTAGREALNVVINNNTFKNLERAAIYCWGLNHFSIKGNIFDDVQSTNSGTGVVTGAIYLNDCYDGFVSDNVSTNSSGTYGTWVFIGVDGDCDNISITGNIIEDPRYGYGYLSIIYFNSGHNCTNFHIFDNTVDGILIPGIEKYGLARAVYDFSVDGGTVGQIGTGTYLPFGAVVTRSYYQVVTQPNSTGGTATVSIDIPTDDEAGIKAAVDEDDSSWTAGWHDAIQDGTLSNNSEDCTDNREVSVSIANENLTAGKVVIFLEYIINNSASYTGKG